MCPRCSLTLQHIPLCLLPYRLRLAVPSRAPHLSLFAWTLLFVGYELVLGRCLIRLSFLWITVAFRFPPFALRLARSSLPYRFCCFSRMWSRCWVSLPIPVTVLLPLLPCPGCWKERTACACTMPFMSRILNGQSKDPIPSLKEIYSHLLNLFADTAFFTNERRSKRRKFFSCPFGTE